MYRLPTGQSAHKIDGVSYAADERIVARHGKALKYCSLDMASSFWVLEMTERARLFSSFVTPSGLFEWIQMPFGSKNAPQIYQRLMDNALYGLINDKDQIRRDHYRITKIK